MPSLTVINTSPLIFLSKGGYLELLRVLSAEIVVPMAVRDEIYAYGEDESPDKLNWAQALRPYTPLQFMHASLIHPIRCATLLHLSGGDASKRMTKDGGQRTNDLQFLFDGRNRQILLNYFTYA
ncbi:MAG: hypothetical protein RH949_01595 [Coleofasciculus sp. A1-SPW-01]|uniref:hypothetical protein n=1 Tax=Coleofasciculus TaxID=669368 RepID=UPI0012FB95A2|nr:hypothetical protein [Coleofasciculus chthonoplastes]